MPLSPRIGAVGAILMRRAVGAVLMRRAVGAVCTNPVSSFLRAPRIIVLPVEAMPPARLRYATGTPPMSAVGAVCTINRG
jgi:hypothetical protein